MPTSLYIQPMYTGDSSCQSRLDFCALEAQPKFISLLIAATSLSHSSICPCTPVGAEGASSSVQSILPAPEHHGNEVVASSEGRSDKEWCWWQRASRESVGMRVGTSKRADPPLATRLGNHSQAPGDQPPPVAPAAKTQFAQLDFSVASWPQYVTLPVVPITTPGSWLSSPQCYPSPVRWWAG